MYGDSEIQMILSSSILACFTGNVYRWLILLIAIYTERIGKLQFGKKVSRYLGLNFSLNREMYGKGKMWGIITSSHLKQSVWNLDRLLHNPIAIESAHIVINDYYEY